MTELQRQAEELAKSAAVLFGKAYSATANDDGSFVVTPKPEKTWEDLIVNTSEAQSAQHDAGRGLHE